MEGNTHTHHQGVDMKNEKVRRIAFWVSLCPCTLILLWVVLCVASATGMLSLILVPAFLVLPLAMVEFGVQRFGDNKADLLYGSAIGYLGFGALWAVWVVTGNAGSFIVPALFWYITIMIPVFVIRKWGSKGILLGTIISWLAPLLMTAMPGNETHGYGGIAWLFLGWIPGLVYGILLAVLLQPIRRRISSILSSRATHPSQNPNEG